MQIQNLRLMCKLNIQMLSPLTYRLYLLCIRTVSLSNSFFYLK